VFSFFVADGRYEEHRDEVLRRMSALAAEAQTNGVTLVHENESHIYGDTAERCRDLVESVGSPALRVAFDPANFVQVGVRPHAEAWPLLAPWVTHFHVKDAVQVDRQGGAPYPAPPPPLALMASVRLPGEGDGELPALLGELARADYRGFLTIEPHLAATMPEASGPERFAAATKALRGLVAAL
jgi:sugar phosphate isomerase/epimerase